MATAPSAASQNAVAHFDLQQEVYKAEDRRPWVSGIYSKTLLKQDDMRLVLTLMDANASMNDHHADGSISIQVLIGKLRLSAEGAEYQISARHLLSLEPSVRHSVLALEPSAFLLTISWPDKTKLQSMPHRGY
jgi:quercetin dioxygenase-like cupin family protein